MNFSAQPDPAYASLQSWMQQWSDLETGLHVLLLAPERESAFEAKVNEVLSGMVSLLDLDADSSLYWLFQLAASSTVAYSASHAMICGALCHLVAPEVGLTPQERKSLSLAALTMNIGMTQLQDQLAAQTQPLSAEQRVQIDNHAARSAQKLRELGVTNSQWLDTVESHHTAGEHDSVSTRVLQLTDRYAAIISPRETRPGRCVTDSARQVVVRQGNAVDSVGHALLKTVGICPPGTFVRLDNGSVAVVLRRSGQPASPWVASVLGPQNHPVLEPELINTALDENGIEAALVTSTVRVRLNHVRLLQLSRMAVGRH